LVLGLGGQDGAIVVDMKHFSQFSMDESTFVATIGPGTTLGNLDTEIYNAGKRAMAHGICPSIRTGGHLTVGGLGPTARQWGLALDHVEEVEVVFGELEYCARISYSKPGYFVCHQRRRC
jgi:FAD/FMN-containing dehydrogenases